MDMLAGCAHTWWLAGAAVQRTAAMAVHRYRFILPTCNRIEYLVYSRCKTKHIRYLFDAARVPKPGAPRSISMARQARLAGPVHGSMLRAAV